MTFFLKVTSFFMSIICFFISTFGIQKKTDYTYTDNAIIEKEEKDLTEYLFGVNDISVSVKGNDNNSGSESSPVKTIQKAKELANEKRDNGAEGEIKIWISEGTYNFTEPLEFTSNDADNISFIAIPGDEVNFDGSLNLTGWKEDTANGYSCYSADVPASLDFNSVFSNGDVLSQTRYPETGYFYIEEENHDGALFTEESSPWEATLGDTQFTPSSQQTIKNFKNIDDVTLRVLHIWVDDYTKLTGYNEETNRYSLEIPMTAIMQESNKYFFENVYEAFDKAGEWYFDREKSKIYYIPLEGENASNLNISVAVTDKLISISNCSDISFEGINFINTNASFAKTDPNGWLGVYGMRSPQAEYDSEGCFEVVSSDNINVKYCNFDNIGICGIKLINKVKNMVITGCNFTDIGCSGIFIDGYNTETENDMTENITVTDNFIDGYGQYFYSAIGVFLTHARNCDISNNEVCNGYYSAINVGWNWGYSYNLTSNISIKNNYIHDIGQGWLSDMGGIYTLGKQPGTIISGNVIRNVAADEGEGGYGGWGIYLDEGSSDIIVEKNLVYDCGSQGFHQHYGEDNIIRNNIFALNEAGQMCSSFYHMENQTGYLSYETDEEHNEFTFEHNILLSNGSPCYIKVENHAYYKDDSNICWDLKTGKIIYNVYYSNDYIDDRIFTDNMKDFGLYNNVQLFNPGFRDALNFDFTLPDDNEDLNNSGFVKWNYNIAGTVTER